MATITTDTFLDSGTARTAGESWTMNGGVLTIRTDTRWHVGAPASMTGSIGATTISSTLGGGLTIDGTDVRWLAYDTGAGVVPAIGTSVTQGGVSGYLLAVYSSLTAAPTAVGAAMPATGFLKFREVTGGNYAAGALAGISANATGADVTGWIEVVQDQSVANTVPRLGNHTYRGDWFYLDNTTGVAGQIFQVPTNGGGAGTRVAAIEIETGVGTGVYEKFTGILSATFTTTNFGTDARSKVCEDMGGGQVRIGNNGTTNVGFLPPAGCRVRIPNIFLRQCTTGARATNAAPNATLGTRPDYVTTSAGVIDFENVLADWYFDFNAPYFVRLVNVFVFDIVTISTGGSAFDIDNLCIGQFNGTSIPLTINACASGGTIANSDLFRTGAAANGHALNISNSSNVDVQNVKAGVFTYARNSSGYGAALINSSNLTLNNIYIFNTFVYCGSSSNVTVTNLDHNDRIVGATNSTTPLYAFLAITSSTNILVDGVSFGLNNTIANVHPYNGIFQVSNGVSNATFRNAGSYASPLNGGSADQVGYIYVDSGASSNIKVQRCYLSSVRNRTYLNTNNTKGVIIQNCHTPTGSTTTNSLNTIVRGCRAASAGTGGQTAVYGTHFFDQFTSTTVGELWVGFNEPTAESATYVTYTFGANAGFTSAGQAAMPNLNDQVTFEWPHYVIGHTSFQNIAPVLTGTNTGNFTYEYQIDTGSGVFSAWQTLNGANLSAETISPTTGFKLKIRATCSVANSTNALTYIRVLTNTTSADIAAGLYPLEEATPTFTLTGLAIGTEVVLFDATYTTELDRQVLATSTYTYNYNWNSDDGDFAVNALIWKNDKIPYITSTTLTDENQSIPLTQSDDLVYNATYTNTHTIDFTNELIILNSFNYNVQEVYSLWKDELLLSTNAQYDFAFTQVGGNSVGGSNSIPYYTFLSNGWKVRPQEANGTTEVVNGILVTDDNSDPFVNTLGAYTVRINYQQPVQAIAVSSSGGDPWATFIPGAYPPGSAGDVVGNTILNLTRLIPGAL